MSTSQQASSTTPNFQPILDKALKEYKRKTGKELTTHPLAEEIKGCSSPDAILAMLQGKANDLNQSQSNNERLTKWLTPTVNVLNALSATLGQGVGTIFPPTQIIFAGINILLVAARDTAASRDALIELFDKIENFFIRLQAYTEVPPTAAMTNVMGKIMAEVLSILAIATKEVKQRRTKTFLKKLIGRKDIEDALQRLDKLEQGELRTVTAQVLKATNDLKCVTDDLKDDAKETKVIVQQIASDISSRDWERMLHDLQGWLTPPDPSTNYNIACSSQHERTAAWVFNEDIYKEWESSGSLFWIHGKAGSGKSILCSAIIKYVIALRDAGLASVAYFYFDFRDVNKKSQRNLLSSLLIQLSSRSRPCLDILSRLYSTYNAGKEQPSEHALVQCLKDMLVVQSPSQLPTYIIMDAIDECPNLSGIPTPREEVLELVKALVDLELSDLRICVTSRPEVDIRTVLQPLAPAHLSLHDQPGQKRDIDEYVRAIVQSDIKMRKWREDDRKLVIATLSEKADGMFRWVFCQLEALRHCLAPSIRDQLNELPRSLDATYERVLDEIQSTNQGRHAHRLLQCLTVAMRPLRVEELAEVLTFELDTAEGELPRFHPDWRWEDQEHAVLSACSSLITVVSSHNSRVIQFSHFSVKEYLTSKRLSTASIEVSRYHIAPEPAHLVLARACLGVLFNLDESGGQDSDMPLLRYATEHWTSHAQVGNVSSCLKDVMETLFDWNKPHFEAWRRVHNAYCWPRYYKRSPLYYAALHGFYDLVQHLINRHPEQITHYNDTSSSPLLAALESMKHVRVAELLVKHGARVHIRGDPPLCHATRFSGDGRVNAVQFLLKRGAHVNAGSERLQTPLHYAAEYGYPEVARILLEYGADVGLQNTSGQVPLHLVSDRDVYETDEGKRLVLAQSLLERCRADVNTQDVFGDTPLHCASYNRCPKIAQLLLDHGANAHAVNDRGCNPLHQMSDDLHRVDPQDVCRVTQLLLEQGVDVNVLDKNHQTPLHIASSLGLLENIRLLLNHGAKADAEDIHGQIPLHLVSRSEPFTGDNANIARLFLQIGMDVNACDMYQETPLHFASSCGNFEIALTLLDHRANVNAKNANGQTPLHLVPLASESKFQDYHNLARLMLERGADVHARDKNQETPLHSASYMSKLETTRLLLDHGANVHAKNVNGQTPLHIVSQHTYDIIDTGNYPESGLVLLLLSRGADVNTRDKYHMTPFLLASLFLKHKVAETLLQNGAEVNAVNIGGQNALHLISQNPRPDQKQLISLFKLLLERDVDMNGRDYDESTALHLAGYCGQVEVAEALLEHAAQVNATDIWGYTPLHRVILGMGTYDYKSSGMHPWELKRYPVRVIGLVKRLLESGADVNAQNKDHETPLHLASRLRLHEMARLLLKHGADVNVMNSEGKTPLQLATGRKGTAMRRLLLE